MPKKASSSGRKPRATTRKIFDIRRPGQAPASATSRPIISGRNILIHDPSVSVDGVGERRPVLGRSKIVINPLTPDQDASESEVKVRSKAKAEPKVKKISLQEPEAPKTVKDPLLDEDDTVALAAVAIDGSNETITPAAADREDQKAVDSEGQQVMITAKHEQPTEEAKVDAAEAPPAAPTETKPAPKEEPVAASSLPTETTVDGDSRPIAKPESSPAPESKPDQAKEEVKDFVVLRHTGHHQTWKTALLVLLVLLLAVVMVDILLDAGALQLDGLPHTDFLSN